MKRILASLLALMLIFACCATASACTEWCGVIGPFFDTEVHSMEELQIEAAQRINQDGDKIIGKRAIVQHYGNVRVELNQYSDSYGVVHHEDEYLITGYTFVEGKVWLHVVYGNNLGWISASLVEISGKYNKPGGDQIGMRCRVIVNSGRARMRADVESPIIEYVGYNDEFRINDVAEAPDGTTWFQIVKDGNRCWVSSTIVAVEGFYGR